ncbi:hypothetical protein NDN08_004853 [Rhodosorus marinus]|uniref:Uncharacterized protein n=1 Tax=Rhodosorus marinus TaxID=101924 RepID=A0AAV8UHR0_9RHOD|nr:hypothetical protein NDN08_004853 [Rhodosorus marinus]
MSGKVECLLVCLVVFVAFHRGLGVPTDKRTELGELLAARPATCKSVVNEDNIVKRLPDANYVLSFKGFTKRVVRVTIKVSGKDIVVKLDARYDVNGKFLRRPADYSKITHLIKGYRFGFHSDCERIPFGTGKFFHSDEFSFENVLDYSDRLKFTLKMKDIPKTQHGDCCFPCFVAEVDMIDVDSEVVRLARAVTSEKCKKRSGGDRICSLNTICRNVIYGTEGDDVIRGTPWKDYIYGMGGNDKIDGLGGDDVIFGGDGNDTIRGGSGRDYIQGQHGNDKMYGGKDGDIILGGLGADKHVGGDGDDFLLDRSVDYNTFYGDDGDDALVMAGKGLGGDGDDRFWSEGSHHKGDIMYGQNGDDYFSTGGFDRQQDRIYGGRGNDIFVGPRGSSGGNDILVGGEGDDYYVGTWSNLYRIG